MSLTSPASFSFGAFGDILALTQIVSTLISILIRSISSSQDYRSLAHEAQSLASTLDCIRTNLYSHVDCRLCPATRRAVHEAVMRATLVVEEMRVMMEIYEGCFCGDDGDRDGDGGVGGKGWIGTLGGWIGMIMWSVRAKDKVEGMKNEVIARIVEINMLLSLKRQGEVSEPDIGLVTSSFQIVQRPFDPLVPLGPSPAYHVGSVASTGLCDHSASDDVLSEDFHANSAASAIDAVEDRSEPVPSGSDLPSYTQAVADGASPPRPLPEPVGPPAYLTSDSERWEKYTSPSTWLSSSSQATHYPAAHDPSTTNVRFVESGGQYDSQYQQHPLPGLVLAPLRRNDADDMLSDELVQPPDEFAYSPAISSSSMTPSQSLHDSTSSYRTSSTTFIGAATSFISSLLATVSGKDSEPMRETFVDPESQLSRPSVDSHLTLEDRYSYPPSARYHPSMSNAAGHANPTSFSSSSSWTETRQTESMRMTGPDSTAASAHLWPGGRYPTAYWDPSDEYDAVEVPPSVYVWMGKGKEEVW